MPGATFTGIDVGADRLHAVSVDKVLRVVRSAVFAALELPNLVAWLDDSAVVAIDAPAHVSTAPHAVDVTLSPKFRLARCAEIGLGHDFGIWVPWVTPTTAPESGWMATGFALYRELREAGADPIEVYPHSAFRILVHPAPLPKKQTGPGIQARVSSLEKLGIDEPNLAVWSHDGLDALVGAVVARDNAAGTARAATCGHDGSAIWLPAERGR
jgi:predicted nuclease with RNAse H fold